MLPNLTAGLLDTPVTRVLLPCTLALALVHGRQEWKIDRTISERGGLVKEANGQPTEHSSREIWL